MRSSSIDFRERIVAAWDRGEGNREPGAKPSGVSVAWVDRLLARRRDTGSIAPMPHGGGPPPASQGESAERLRKAVADGPDATLEGRRQAAGVACGPSAACRAPERLGLPREKGPSGLRSGAALS